MKGINNLRIGVFGLISPDTESSHELSDVIIKDPVEAARNISAELKNKADIIILLSSQTHKMNVDIAEKVEGVHFILGGDKNGGHVYYKLSRRTVIMDSGHED